MDEIEHMSERKTLPLLGNMFPKWMIFVKKMELGTHKQWNGTILWMNEVSDIVEIDLGMKFIIHWWIFFFMGVVYHMAIYLLDETYHMDEIELWMNPQA